MAVASQSSESGSAAVRSPLLWVGGVLAGCACTLLVPDWPGLWLRARAPDGAQVAVGSVSERVRDVRVRHQRNITWYGIESRDPVFLKDTLFSGEGSETLVDLAGGGTLRLGPNSLVVIDRDRGGISVEMIRGSLAVKTQDGLGARVLINDAAGKLQVKLTNGETYLERNSSASAPLIVARSGNVSVESGAGVSSIREGQGLSLDVTGKKVSLGGGYAILEGPRDLHAAEEKTDVTLTWRLSEGVAKAQLQVADEPGFLRPVVDRGVKGETRHSLRLPPGRWYWRVDTGVRGAEVRRFIVRPAAAVALLRPGPDESVNLLRNGAGINFTWTHQLGFESYRLSVVDVTSGKDILSQVVPRPPVHWTGRTGRFRWQVTGNLSDGRKVPSEVWTFGSTEMAALAAPATSRSGTVVTRGNGAAAEAVVTWKPVAGAQVYQLDYSPDEGFGRDVVTKTLYSDGSPGDEPVTASIPFKNHTRIYWRVSARSTEGIGSAPSPVNVVSAPRGEMKLYGPDDGAQWRLGGEPLRLSWAIPDGEDCTVSVARNGGLSPPTVSERRSQGWYDFSGKDPGRHYWGVSCTREGATRASAVRHFDVLPAAPKLAPPSLRAKQLLPLERMHGVDKR